MSESGGAVKWFKAVTKTRNAIAEGARGLIPGYLDSVASFAERYSRPVSHEPQRRLKFVRAKELRRITEEGWSRERFNGALNAQFWSRKPGSAKLGGASTNSTPRISSPASESTRIKLARGGPSSGGAGP